MDSAGGRGGRGGGGGGGGVSSANANISAPAANFAAALKLAVEMLKEPVYDDSDFERMQQQRIKALEVTPTEPTQLGAEMLSRHLSPFQPGDVLYSPTREEQLAELKKVTLDDARQFHDQFYGANFGVLAVVGPVDQAAVKRAAEELLGKWNTSMAYKPIAAEYKAVSAINQKIETPDKANAQFEAGERFAMSESIRITRRCCWPATCSAGPSPRAFRTAFAIAKGSAMAPTRAWRFPWRAMRPCSPPPSA